MEDNSVAGIVSFYSIVHTPPSDVGSFLGEAQRVLSPGGLLQLAFHAGAGTVVNEDFLESGAALEFFYHDTEQIISELSAVDFTVVEQFVRAPYEQEYPSQRCYLLAKKQSTHP